MNKGGIYSKLSLNYYFTNYTFTEGGGKERLPSGTKFTDKNATFYMEYGITDRLTVSASVPYKKLRSSYRQEIQAGDRTLKRRVVKHYRGVGDMEFGLKYCFLTEPVVTSLQFFTKTAWAYSGNEKVMPGNNQNDYEARILLGKSLWPFPGYCGAEFGYRWRTNKPSDEYRYLLEFGFNPFKKLSLRFKLDGVKSVKNAGLPDPPQPLYTSYIDEETGEVIKVRSGSSTTQFSSNPSLGLEYDLGKLEMTASYQAAKNWFLEFSYTNYPYGKNISPGDQYSFGIVYYK